MKLRKVLIIPDCHHPYVDKKAWGLMLKAGRLFKPDETIILGDFIDFYSVSSHSKDPERAVSLKTEVESGIDALSQVKALGASKNVFIAGNHSYRLERYLQDKAPELFHFVKLEKVLSLKAKGFTYIPYRRTYKVGKLALTHDLGNAGRYAHYKALDCHQGNIVIGHTHRIGFAVEGNTRGERHVSAMFGWLGDNESIDYMHKDKIAKNWSHGFGIAYIEDSGNAHIQPVTIMPDYSCIIEGRHVK